MTKVIFKAATSSAEVLHDNFMNNVIVTVLVSLEFKFYWK